MYNVFIETHFAASHKLFGYQGLCKELHGHTWKVRVEVETDRINKIGISFDFKKLKMITESVIRKIDHKHLNDIPPFDTQNPTAENLSRYIFENVKEKLRSGIKLSRVTVWESSNYAVSYCEPQNAKGK
jgi:6-pyruvoyltetrahydropterin/6-carboxytetrahydropterin synthase